MWSLLKKIMRILPDWAYISLKYYYHFQRFPNLKNPKTFNEKLQWLKLHDKKPIYTTMVDKYEAKKYVADIIGEEYIVPTYGVWERFDDIDFAALPEQFVLKCTHDCGGLVIVRDKGKLDIEAAREKIEKSLKTNYFWEGREWPYRNVKPRIIAEKYLDSETDAGMTDYKFYCFRGEPRFLYVSEGLEDHDTAKISFITMDWEFAEFQRDDYATHQALPKKPELFDEMVQIAKKLSKDQYFMRVDLYECKKQIYFSELTLTPASGFSPLQPSKCDEQLGEWIELPQKKK